MANMHEVKYSNLVTTKRTLGVSISSGDLVITGIWLALLLHTFLPHELTCWSMTPVAQVAIRVPFLFVSGRRLNISSPVLSTSHIFVSRETRVQTCLLPVVLSAVSMTVAFFLGAGADRWWWLMGMMAVASTLVMMVFMFLPPHLISMTLLLPYHPWGVPMRFLPSNTGSSIVWKRFYCFPSSLFLLLLWWYQGGGQYVHEWQCCRSACQCPRERCQCRVSMSCILMSQVTHINESCPTWHILMREEISLRKRTDKCRRTPVVSTRHVRHINDSCHSYSMRHYTHISII